MENLPGVIAAWFHLIAIVSWLGLIIYSALIFFPSVVKAAESSKAGQLADYQGKAIGITLAAIVVFAITGFALIVMSGFDEGVGNVFANDWTMMIFAKHILIILMIILEFWVLFIAIPRLIQAWRQPAAAKEPAGLEPRRIIAQIQIANVVAIVFGLTVLFVVAALP